jgi:hypothetical protein
MFGATPVKRFVSEKTETISSRTLPPAPAGLFERAPRFTRKHYSQNYYINNQANISSSKSIVLSYDVGKKMGDTFFNDFLPNLVDSLDPHITDEDLLRDPGHHHEIFTSISRGKYLRHFIAGIPGSDEVYTYNLELDRINLNNPPAPNTNIHLQLCEFEGLLPFNINHVGIGSFILYNISLNHRSTTKPNQFNFVFKFAFHVDGEKILSKFSNDEHSAVDIVLNIHFNRTPGNNAPGRISTTPELKLFLTDTLRQFSASIQAEIVRDKVFNLSISHLDEITNFNGPSGCGAAPIANGFWLNPGNCAYTRAQIVGIPNVGQFYQPNNRALSLPQAPIHTKHYNTTGNGFGIFAVDDDEDDPVNIIFNP